MTRGFVIHGECLVRVKGNGALAEGGVATLHELGLTAEGVRVAPAFHHQPVRADDFGPDVAPERLWMGAECDLHMELIHYDRGVLEKCLREAMGGADADGT